ncbi:MAG: hypothetical protein KIT14_23980 [bacterium]|nr:hypothetical protein [bacterium]
MRPVPQLTLPADHPLYRLQRGALGVGGIAIVVCAALGIAANDPTPLLRSYLVAYVFWTGLALGCLGVLMIHHVTGGAWGMAIRRLLESGARTLPLMALLFVPIALGLPRIYEWAQPEHVAHDPVLQHKALYLNVPFFLGRAVVYFLAWILMVRALTRWSLLQDTTTDPKPGARLELLSRGGLVLMVLTMSFAGIDWLMSLEPHWFSTIYGILFIGGCGLSAFALMIPMAALLANNPPVRGIIKVDQVADLGKLMLAFVMLWAYFSFSQFLIIWSGNLPEEIPWYLKRTSNGWQYFAIFIVIFHFALPFALLLSRSLKRSAAKLAAVAVALIVVRMCDVFFLVQPVFRPEGFSIRMIDVASLLGVGGLWIWFFVRQLEGRPLLPLRDPSVPVLE